MSGKEGIKDLNKREEREREREEETIYTYIDSTKCKKGRGAKGWISSPYGSRGSLRIPS